MIECFFEVTKGKQNWDQENVDKSTNCVQLSSGKYNVKTLKTIVESGQSLRNFLSKNWLKYRFLLLWHNNYCICEHFEQESKRRA